MKQKSKLKPTEKKFSEPSSKMKQTEIGMIPEDWEVESISEVAQVVGGGTPSTKNSEYWEGDIAWITPRDLSNFKFRYIKRGERNITKEGLGNSSAKLLPKGTILLTTRAPVGYLAIADNQATTNQGFHSLTPNNKATSEFLFYLLKKNVEMLKSNASGTTFGELSGSRLKALKFAFPNISEQSAIAKILSDLDSKIELNQQMNKTLEAIGQAIFKHRFVDFEFPNEEGKPYKSSGGEMVDSELGVIPKGWNVKNVQDLLVFEKGVEPGSKFYMTEDSQKNIRFIRVGDINTPGRENTFIPIELAGEKFCRENDILLSLDATIGIVRIGMNGVFSSGIRKVYSRKKGDVPKAYIYSLLTSKYIQDTIYTYAIGTTILHAGASLDHMDLPIPNVEILKKFSNVTEP